MPAGKQEGDLRGHQVVVDHLVKGPPGSGKTNLLLLRGKQLIGSNVPDVIVVVHTRTLQEFIRSGAPTKIVTFGFASRDPAPHAGATTGQPCRS
jgi:superfamily I DNA and RNA helicase